MFSKFRRTPPFFDHNKMIGSIKIPTIDVSEIASALHDHAQKIQMQLDDNIFKAFERYDYSKEWLLDNIHRVSIQHMPCMATGTYVKIFLVDDEQLFGTIEKHIMDFENGKYELEQSIEFIKEVPNGSNS